VDVGNEGGSEVWRTGWPARERSRLQTKPRQNELHYVTYDHQKLPSPPTALIAWSEWNGAHSCLQCHVPWVRWRRQFIVMQRGSLKKSANYTHNDGGTLAMFTCRPARLLTIADYGLLYNLETPDC
jgi:hypothetical protein